MLSYKQDIQSKVHQEANASKLWHHVLSWYQSFTFTIDGIRYAQTLYCLHHFSHPPFVAFVRCNDAAD